MQPRLRCAGLSASRTAGAPKHADRQPELRWWHHPWSNFRHNVRLLMTLNWIIVGIWVLREVRSAL